MNAAVIVEQAILASFAVLGIVTMIAADALPYRLFRNIGGSPGIFPWLLGALVTAASISQLVVSALRRRRSKPSSPGVGRFESSRPFQIAGLCVLYTLLFPWLGYIVSTILWLGVLMWLLRPSHRLRYVLVMLLLVAVTFTLFQVYLPVRLPAGRLIRMVL